MRSNAVWVGSTSLLGVDAGWRLRPGGEPSPTERARSSVSGTYRELRARAVPLSGKVEVAANDTFDVGASLAYNRLIALKAATANVAMHLDGAWRAGLFKQLDQLLDPEEWDFSDKLPSPESFRTFLRLVTYLPIRKRPGLGATSNGNVLAAWVKDGDRLTMEFLPDDHVRWSLARQQDGERETASGCTQVRRLEPVLKPYEPEFWFNA